MAKVMILGAGSFGIALALLCHNCGHEVTVWSHRREEAERLQVEREQKKLLPGVKLPQEIAFTATLEAAQACDLAILAVPSFAVRQTSRLLAPHLREGAVVACVAKGLEQGSYADFSTVIGEEIPNCPNVILSGPSHAEEVSRGEATSIVAASHDMEAAQKVQDWLMSPAFRVYVNDDVIGVELGGAGYDIYAMANSWLTMALNGCGWLLVVVLLTPRMESLRQKVGGGDEVWLGLITCSASIGLFGYMASQYYNKIVVDPAQAWSCIAGTVVMVACVKFSKKMPWLKEYGLGIAIVIGIVVGALVR